MSLTNGSDTISANLPLTDSGEKSYKSQSNTGTQHGSSLNTCNSRSQNTENALEHEVTGKTIQPLCTRKRSQHQEVTECTIILFQCTDRCITCDSHTIRTTDT